MHKLFLKTHKLNQKEESTNYLPLSTVQYFMLQSFSTHSPDFTGLKLEKCYIFFFCSFIFCWIRTKITDLESDPDLDPDPDPDRIHLQEKVHNTALYFVN